MWSNAIKKSCNIQLGNKISEESFISVLPAALNLNDLVRYKAQWLMLYLSQPVLLITSKYVHLNGEASHSNVEVFFLIWPGTGLYGKDATPINPWEC